MITTKAGPRRRHPEGEPSLVRDEGVGRINRGRPDKLSSGGEEGAVGGGRATEGVRPEVERGVVGVLGTPPQSARGGAKKAAVGVPQRGEAPSQDVNVLGGADERQTVVG